MHLLKAKEDPDNVFLSQTPEKDPPNHPTISQYSNSLILPENKETTQTITKETKTITHSGGLSSKFSVDNLIGTSPKTDDRSQYNSFSHLPSIVASSSNEHVNKNVIQENHPTQYNRQQDERAVANQKQLDEYNKIVNNKSSVIRHSSTSSLINDLQNTQPSTPKHQVSHNEQQHVPLNGHHVPYNNANNHHFHPQPPPTALPNVPQQPQPKPHTLLDQHLEILKHFSTGLRSPQETFLSPVNPLPEDLVRAAQEKNVLPSPVNERRTFYNKPPLFQPFNLPPPPLHPGVNPPPINETRLEQIAAHIHNRNMLFQQHHKGEMPSPFPAPANLPTNGSFQRPLSLLDRHANMFLKNAMTQNNPTEHYGYSRMRPESPRQPMHPSLMMNRYKKEQTSQRTHNP